MDIISRIIVGIGLIVMAAMLLAMPYMLWLAIDRTPPLTLYDGKITEKVIWNEEAQRHEIWRTVTWRAHRRKAHWPANEWDCQGLSHREVVHKQTNKLLPFLAYNRKGVFHPDSDNPYEGTVTTPPLVIGTDFGEGEARYRVTQYYRCNWLQSLLGWEIINPSPYIDFRVHKEEVFP